MAVPVPRVLPTPLAKPVLGVFDEVEVAGEDRGLFVVVGDFLPELGYGLDLCFSGVAARLEVSVDHVEVANGGVL